MTRPHGNTKHGCASRGKKTDCYKSWESMLRRCLNPRQSSYGRYGGSGVPLCERWRSFTAFHEDMGDPVGTARSLDRIDSTRGYEPGNCRWVDMKSQQRNRTNNRLFTIDGETHCLQHFAETLGTGHSVILDRLRRGWSEERALTQPVRPMKRPRRTAIGKLPS